MTQKIAAEKSEKAPSRTAEKSVKSSEIDFSDVEKEKVKIRRSKLPPPRARNKIKVKFTERVFPTPTRESRQAEEDEWIQKNAAARKRVGEVELELLPHEKEDGYLEEKGRKLMEKGEFEGAINALNVAVQIFPQNPRPGESDLIFFTPCTLRITL